MKSFFSTLLSIAVALGPFAPIPAEARKRVQAPTSFFCPMGALASDYLPTSNKPIGDGCFGAPQAATNGGTGGFKLSNCWTASGTANSYMATPTNYAAANASPLTVSTPWNSPGCEYPVGYYSQNSTLADPAPGGTSAFPDCIASATGSFAGFPVLTCKPTLANSPGGVFTISGYDFSDANGGAWCLPIEFPVGIGTGVTDIVITNNNFKNTTGTCSTWQFNPTMVHEDPSYRTLGIRTKVYNNTFDGNGFVWRSNSGPCAKNIDCNPVQAFLINGPNDIEYNLFTNWIGRTIATNTGTNQNLTENYNLWLGGDVSGPEHGEFTQTFTLGTPNGDAVFVNNNWWQTTGSTTDWDAMVLTTYTVAAGGGWNHILWGHNISIPGFMGGNTNTGTATLTGCSIAAGGSTLVCTGATGGRIGAGQQSNSSGCSNTELQFQLGYLISATGVQGTDWDNAIPGGGQWVSNGGSTWALDGNPPGDVFAITAGISGNTMTVSADPTFSIDPTALQSSNARQASTIFTNANTGSPVNFSNGDAVQAGNNTYHAVTALGATAGNFLISTSFGLSAANLQAAINLAAGSGTTYVTPTNTPDITAGHSNTTITLTNKTTGNAGNTAPSVYTAAGTSAGSFPSATLRGGVTAFTTTVQLNGTPGGAGQYTISGSAQTVPTGSTIFFSMYPYYAGQWSVVNTATCSTLGFVKPTIPAVISYMGGNIFEGSAWTNNLADSSASNVANWLPWYQQVVSPNLPGCVANDMIGADPSNPTFTIFGTQNFDPNKFVTGGVNRWNNTSFVSNLCGP